MFHLSSSFNYPLFLLSSTSLIFPNYMRLSFPLIRLFIEAINPEEGHLFKLN